MTQSAQSGDAIALVCGSDDRYAMPAAVALYSALRHLNPTTRPEIVYLCDRLSDSSRRRIAAVVAQVRPGTPLRFIDPPPEAVSGLPTSGHIAASSYLRLIFARYVSQTVVRAVYIDGDTFVRQDLTPLFTETTGNYTLAACRDGVQPTVAWVGPAAQAGVRSGEAVYGAGHPYFNAGVLSIDVPLWRQLDIEGRALRFAHEHPNAIEKAHDQDLLNILFADAWSPLDPTWNVCSELFFLERFGPDPYRDELLARRREIWRSAKIVHFTGQPKPWHHWSTHPYTNEWARTLLQSGWFTTLGGLRWQAIWMAKRAWIWCKLATGRLRRREAVYNVPRVGEASVTGSA